MPTDLRNCSRASMFEMSDAGTSAGFVTRMPVGQRLAIGYRRNAI
jgi:hypothetical protein